MRVVRVLIAMATIDGLARVQPFGPNGGGGPVAAAAQVATQTAWGLAECVGAETRAGNS